MFGNKGKAKASSVAVEPISVSRADTSSLLDIIKKPASSYGERVTILDARDKLIRTTIKKETDVNKAKAKIGTCQEMCPERERYFRIDTNQISLFEKNSDNSVDIHRMVKEYRRAGADQAEPLPSDLRPPTILLRTMDYLCTDIVDRTSENEEEWFDFLWSRTRAIRKEMTQQALNDITAVELMERIARFHIYCTHRLCEMPPNAFDPKINRENLSKTLQSLKHFYEDLAQKGVNTKNEAEFRGYDILMNLTDPDVLREVKSYRSDIRTSAPVREAIAFFFAFSNKNYIKFFLLLKKTTFLNSCLLHHYINSVRLDALKIIRRAFVVGKGSELYPTQDLLQQLGFDDVMELKVFLENVNIKFSDDSRLNVVLLRGATSEVERLSPRQSQRLVLAKLTTPPSEAIYGGPLPHSPYRSFKLQESFNQNGNLIFDLSQLDNNLLNDSLEPEERIQPSSKDEANSLPEVVYQPLTTTNLSSDPRVTLFGSQSTSGSSQKTPFSFKFGGFQPFDEKVQNAMIPSAEVSNLVEKKMNEEIEKKRLDMKARLIAAKILESVTDDGVQHISDAALKKCKKHFKKKLVDKVYTVIMVETIGQGIRLSAQDAVRRRVMARKSAVYAFVRKRRLRLVSFYAKKWRTTASSRSKIKKQEMKKAMVARIATEDFTSKWIALCVKKIAQTSFDRHRRWFLQIGPQEIFVTLMRDVVHEEIKQIATSVILIERRELAEKIERFQTMRREAFAKECLKTWRLRVAETRCRFMPPGGSAPRPRLVHRLKDDQFSLPISQKPISILLKEFRSSTDLSESEGEQNTSKMGSGSHIGPSSSKISSRLISARRNSLGSCFDLDPMPLNVVASANTIRKSILKKPTIDVSSATSFNLPVSSEGSKSLVQQNSNSPSSKSETFKLPSVTNFKRKHSISSSSPDTERQPCSKIKRSFSEALSESEMVTRMLERTASLDEFNSDVSANARPRKDESLETLDREILNMNTSMRLERLRQSIDMELELNSSFSASLELLAEL